MTSTNEITGTKETNGHEDLVTYEVHDGVATIELNRPHVLNALSDDTIIALRDAILRLEDDPTAFVGVLTGRGRAFSSGADVRQRQMRTREEFLRLGGPQGRGARVQDVLFHVPQWKPVLAAVHGYVMGAGLHLAFLCDMVVADQGTKFQITETRRGLDGGGFWQIMERMGVSAFASEVALTGRYWTAEESVAHGLIAEVTPSGGALGRARELAQQIMRNPPLAVREIVRIRRIAIQEVELAHVGVGPRHLHLTEDFQESARAFVEKREPGPYRGI